MACSATVTSRAKAPRGRIAGSYRHDGPRMRSDTVVPSLPPRSRRARACSPLHLAPLQCPVLEESPRSPSDRRDSIISQWPWVLPHLVAADRAAWRPFEGLVMGPAAQAATYFDPTPILWAEAQSLLDPWTNLTLICRAKMSIGLSFQLFKDGVLLESVNSIAPEYHFSVEAVTAETQGLYRCRTNTGQVWTELSNLVELSGPGSLAAPSLSAGQVSWVTPDWNTTLVCRAWLQGVTFLLTREGEDGFLEEVEAPKDTKATFSIQRGGNYSCSYRTHAAGQPSPPSAAVSIEGLEVPPPPSLSGKDTGVQRPGTSLSLLCTAPLSGVHFQLRRGEEVLVVTMHTSSPDRVYFDMTSLTPADSGIYTCRYQLPMHVTWSLDSAPLELLISDETLAAPELLAEPSGHLRPGAHVSLRCQAPRANVRFVLERQGACGHQGLDRQSPEGSVAQFDLHNMSVLDSGNYSCIYVDLTAPFPGSASSEPVELHVDGPLPKPQLRPLWQGPVSPGHNAVFRCESSLSSVIYQLLHDGEPVNRAVKRATREEEMVLTYVGPQDAGKYSCRYYIKGLDFWSEPSDSLELQVAGVGGGKGIAGRGNSMCKGPGADSAW
ncbi:PREDICTED: alpha-1B-glycoprotein-like [Elephantulus edwardii]|uniref:alpha-1B-glycoprotein-like n=1 Tax=Elephantulus edwardii TaxID=28737 RepID=UPI0003F0A867|nr:PREDICTED: alpha-1B-glycoprotein-like [Elephantulus edwardii]